MTQTLLNHSDLPDFANFNAQEVTPALDELLPALRAAVEQVVDPATPATWNDFVEPLAQAADRVDRVWGLVGHLKGVADSPEIRAVYTANQPRVTEIWTDIGQDARLFAKYRALAAGHGPDGKDWAGADPVIARERQRAVELTLRGFRMGGAELEGPARERYAEVAKRLADLSRMFSEHLLDATNAGRIRVLESERLAGLPPDVVDAAREEAEGAGEAGWTFTLRAPSYLPVMTYARDQALRREMYTAFVTRASELGNPTLDNGPIIDEMLALRGEKAGLLGFENAAEVSLEPKMADSPEQVNAFLRDLARRARPQAEDDLAEVRRFAAEHLGLQTLEPWDMAFAGEQLKEARYAFSDNEVKQYFPVDKVLQGLFDVAHRLYGIHIEEDCAPTWHPDVRFWRISNGQGELIGRFYTDLYARPTKRGGAWMGGQRDRKLTEAGVQTPVAYLVCNFSAPVGSRPALLTHDEITTLFHEMGHGLHHLLTQVSTEGVSGISGVEWDAVELPSQFMENFCWEYDVVKAMSAHVDTGEPLPRALFERMQAARNFQSGLVMLRQIELSLFDMRVHQELAHAGAQERVKAGAVQQILDEVRCEVALTRPPQWNRFQAGFAHIFAGGYAAGYYSYKWAEVLSADAYAAFEEHADASGVAPNEAQEVGRRFLNEVLAVGGSRPALESFQAFRGRAPEIDALLRHNGIGQPA